MSWVVIPIAGAIGLRQTGKMPASDLVLLPLCIGIALIGVVIAGLAYRLAMEAFAHRRAAIWAAFVAAALPLLVYLTKFSKADVPYSAAFLAAALFHLRALRTPTTAVYGWFAF